MKNPIKIFAIAFALLASFSLASRVSAEDQSSEAAAPAALPTIAALPASDAAETAITLNGRIQDDGGSPILAAGFMWGTEGNYANSISSPDNLQEDGTFSETLTGLTCATTYDYSVFAINSAGTANLWDMTFTTSDCSPVPQSPIVEILEAPTHITATSATLSGIIKQQGSAPIIESGFTWGTDANYGHTASTLDTLAAGAAFYKTLSGLACETVYHYSVFATNSVGTGTVSDSTFTTSLCPPPGSVGSNDDEGSGSIPNGTGSNNGEGAPDIIPNGQGSNGEEGTPDIIPNGQGGNDNDTPTTTESVNGNTASFSRGGSSSGSTGFRVFSNMDSLIAAANGDSADSCIILETNLRLGSEGEEVSRLQELLNKFMGSNLAISGKFDSATKAAVESFQAKYADEILAPWGETNPSGIVSFTTLKKLNELSCNQTFDLSPLAKFLIEKYKQNPQTVNDLSTTTPAINSESTTTPIEVGSAPSETQTAGAADSAASSGIFEKIASFFKNLF